ncbi:MAG TPA: hypothetical protein VJN96_14405 [Vicinamibacterales bacterium]|nr:hypothetical protein [Vicinamibacterales bacterium]
MSFDDAQKILDVTLGQAKAGASGRSSPTVKSSSNEIPFADEAFEIVVCAGLLEHQFHRARTIRWLRFTACSRRAALPHDHGQRGGRVLEDIELVSHGAATDLGNSLVDQFLVRVTK